MFPAPSQRLLWATAVLIPVAALAGPLPGLWPLCGLGLIVLGGLAGLDLLWSRQASGLPRAILAPIHRLSTDRPARIPLILQRTAGTTAEVRLALVLPAAIESPQPDLRVRLAATDQRSLVHWPCTARRRGRFEVGPVCLEIPSRWGFWLLRTQQAVAAEARVYPNLFAERNELTALLLNRGAAGIMLRRAFGRGREFERLREYQPGDSFDEIHWKGTAKRGHPVTKVFQVERTQEIHVVVDASRLSGRLVTLGNRTVTTLERFITATMVLMLAADRQGDRFGLMVHDARVRALLPAGRGKSHFGACREALHALEPGAGSPDFAEIFALLRNRLRRRSLLVFLTDLSDPVLAEEFTRHIPVLSRQHLIFVNQIRIPGVEPLFARPIADAQDIPARLAGHYQHQEAEQVAVRLHPLGVRSAVLAHEHLATQMVNQYMQVKRRQLL